MIRIWKTGICHDRKADGTPLSRGRDDGLEPLVSPDDQLATIGELGNDDFRLLPQVLDLHGYLLGPIRCVSGTTFSIRGMLHKFVLCMAQQRRLV